VNKKELKSFLDDKANEFEHPKFLQQDPIQIPHQFQKKEDIEISAFLIATIAWGNRVSIIRSGNRMMEFMGNDPYSFILNYQEKDLKPLKNFVHRTLNGLDLCYFIKALHSIYTQHGGLESAFSKIPDARYMYENIHEFKKIFFSLPHEKRTQKHVSDPLNGSAAKRLNMYLRWMVRRSNKGVDFGIWKTLNTAQLSCPLDVHSGNVARSLGLLKRKQNDFKALLELDTALRKFDPLDPIKYDFALFGLGVFEGFK
jgi:uncharacterized protein (TIGR02757 family)|tara:strand:- start:7214 stop:7981 length:768 start_codon:yes stop_codon:yes gene_type:complete